MSVIINTDGACKGNPGPGGWGVLLQSSTGRQREAFGGVLQTTNNRMELTAVIMGLSLLKKPCDVIIRSDSQYVVKGCEQWLSGWKRNNWRNSSGKPVKNDDLWRELDGLMKKHLSIKFEWVKGHAGDPANEIADKLANQGILCLPN